MAAVPGSGAACLGMGETPSARTKPQVSTAIDIFIRSRYFKAGRLYRENKFSLMYITGASLQRAGIGLACAFQRYSMVLADVPDSSLIETDHEKIS